MKHLLITKLVSRNITIKLSFILHFIISVTLHMTAVSITNTIRILMRISKLNRFGIKLSVQLLFGCFITLVIILTLLPQSGRFILRRIT